MPSSSEAVATSARISPAFSFFSAASRSFRRHAAGRQADQYCDRVVGRQLAGTDRARDVRHCVLRRQIFHHHEIADCVTDGDLKVLVAGRGDACEQAKARIRAAGNGGDDKGDIAERLLGADRAGLDQSGDLHARPGLHRGVTGHCTGHCAAREQTDRVGRSDAARADEAIDVAERLRGSDVAVIDE